MHIHQVTRSITAVAAMMLAASVAVTSVAARQTASATSPLAGLPAGLKFDKMLYLTGDQISTVPSGYVWQVQSILSTDKALQEGGAASFMSGFKNESESSVIARWQMRSNSMWVDGTFYYVAGFPLAFEAGTKISASVNGKVLVVMQLKIE